VHPAITKIIACQVVIEELLPLLPEGTEYETLDLGLHVNPDKLRITLQEKIDASSNEEGTILLGYGLCSRAVVGLRSERCSLVVPCVDDCIGIFLGSREAYLKQVKAEPGTYYLTKGWIEAGDNLFGDQNQIIQRYGPEQAEVLIKKMLQNYTRLVFINTGKYRVEHYREYTERTASRYGLRFQEIFGATILVEKMVNGPWDEDFVVIPPGQTITYEAFYASPRWTTPIITDDLENAEQR
jgi:Protein of unknown function (DUF1638)